MKIEVRNGVFTMEVTPQVSDALRSLLALSAEDRAIVLRAAALNATTRAPAPATTPAPTTKGDVPETNQDAGNTAPSASEVSRKSAGARPSSLTESKA